MSKFNKSELIKRITVFIIGAPIVIGSIILGGYFILIATLIGCALSAIEYAKLSKQRGLDSIWWLQTLAITGFVVGFVNYGGEFLIGLFVVYFLIRSFLILHGTEPEKMVNGWALDIVGTLYLALGWSFFIKIRYFGLQYQFTPDNIQQGLWTVGTRMLLLVLFTIWLYDTGAYFGGRAIGHRKLMPVASPNKTWEGMIIATIVAIASSLGLGYLLVREELDVLSLLGLGIIISAACQTGDLLESLLKRAANTKDSANILPGHGGMLDRFDSLVLVMPIAYYYLKYLAIL
jgi:phosphatidate cytidylyltransferase